MVDGKGQRLGVPRQTSSVFLVHTRVTHRTGVVDPKLRRTRVPAKIWKTLRTVSSELPSDRGRGREEVKERE